MPNNHKFYFKINVSCFSHLYCFHRGQTLGSNRVAHESVKLQHKCSPTTARVCPHYCTSIPTTARVFPHYCTSVPHYCTSVPHYSTSVPPLLQECTRGSVSVPQHLHEGTERLASTTARVFPQHLHEGTERRAPV